MRSHERLDPLDPLDPLEPHIWFVYVTYKLFRFVYLYTRMRYVRCETGNGKTCTWPSQTEKMGAKGQLNED